MAEMEWDDEIRQDLQVWADIADQVHRYEGTVDDYTNDLCYRDSLEAHGRSEDPELAAELRERMAELDARFQSGTVDDAGGELGYYFNTKLKAGWWWQRVPASGPLAEYLRTRAAERPPTTAGRFRRLLGGT